MSRRLSDGVVAERMVELRNLRKLYALARTHVAAQSAVIAAQKERIAGLEEQVTLLRKLTDTQNIRIAELETMVFGRKRRPPGGTVVQVSPEESSPVERIASSYHRPTPDAADVTATEHCPITACGHCGGTLTNLTEHVRYVEDVPLPGLTPGYQPHLVTKYLIARGACTACGRVTVGRDLGGAETILGSNVRLLAADLISRMGLSYSQVSGLLLGLYGLHVSDGEIANLLQKQHEAWLPAYSQLARDIRAAPLNHIDETPWPVQELQGAGYAWDVCDGGSGAVCFALCGSRGARYAQELFGQGTATPFHGVRVSDDYGAYRNRALPGIQQLCWAHPLRKLRDLAHCAEIPSGQLPFVQDWYGGFAAIYEALRHYLAEPYNKSRRESQAASLWSQLQQLLRSRPGSASEPAKLARLKAQLIRAGKDRLFVCLPADTPCDNNRAERDLRQLVCKRKRSFGSKTQKGANALATVLSLCTTTWRRAQSNGNPAGYFTQLAALVE